MKKNICILHGWGANVSKLENLGEELTNLGWNVFIPQIPFFDAPEAKNAWLLADFSKEIEKQACNYFKGHFYFLFGHSFGGRIAIKTAAKNDNNLKGIILCAAAGISRTNKLKRIIFQVIARVFKPLAQVPIFKKLIYRLAGASDYLRVSSEAKKETFRNIIAEDLKPLAKDIRIPTLILWGKMDKITPLKDAFYLHSAVKNSVLETYKNEGHRLPYNLPEELAKEIDNWYSKL